MNDETAVVQLSNLLEWSKEKVRDISQPPWAFYQYMKLTETAEAILKGMASTLPTPVDLLKSERHLGNGLRLSVDNDRPENVQHHSDIVEVNLPM